MPEGSYRWAHTCRLLNLTARGAKTGLCNRRAAVQLPGQATVAVPKTMAPTVKVRILAMVTVPNGMRIPVPSAGKGVHATDL